MKRNAVSAIYKWRCRGAKSSRKQFEMRRFTGNIKGEQYLANTDNKEVHDLDPEMVECRIDEIISAGKAEPYPSQSAANAAGYEDCQYCIGPLRLR